ncbi:MAG: type II toxin-antitoxin system VapC family toxin [Deltaproteobacteria bacterium]|nr:type II toxin-antitoxin system VapC family toxin [Deltaproteobacteria bacterium]
MYLDTAYIAKTYVNEPDSAAVRALLIGKRNMHSSALCGPEFYCVLQRHVREGSLTKRQAALLREKYHEDVEAGVWTLIPMDNAVIARVESSLSGIDQKIFIRAGDAIHLVSAQLAGFEEIWSNDRHLLGAAPAFGLTGRRI